MKQAMRVREGLYDPANEHDACGVGFVANIRGEKSHDVVHKGVQVLATSSIAALAAAIPRRATAPASWCRYLPPGRAAR